MAVVEIGLAALLDAANEECAIWQKRCSELEARLAALEAGGMVMVPMVATPAMCIAGATADGGDDPMQSAWQAMLAARPQGGTND